MNFSPNRPAGPIRSSSRDIRPLWSTFYVIFLCGGWIAHAWELGRVLSTNSEEPLKQGVVSDCIHGSSTRGNSEESRLPTRKSLKNKELVRIAYINRPRVGGVWRVDWCICWPTCKALKKRSCSRLHQWMVHAWEVFDWWICGPTCRALKTRSHSGLNFFIFFLSKKILVLLSASFERFGVSRKLDFFNTIIACSYVLQAGGSAVVYYLAPLYPSQWASCSVLSWTSVLQAGGSAVVYYLASLYSKLVGQL